MGDALRLRVWQQAAQAVPLPQGRGPRTAGPCSGGSEWRCSVLWPQTQAGPSRDGAQPRRAPRQRRHHGRRGGAGGEAGQAAPGNKVGACRVAEPESVVSGICLLGKQKKKRRKGGEIYHKKSVKSAEFLHEKGGISIWPQLPSEATEASNENEFKTQADVFLDGVRGTERRPPPRLSPRASLPSCPGHTGPLRSVRGPQWGPPLPSRSSQCSGETLRPTRSMQWRTSEQDAKSATRGFSGWGGGSPARTRQGCGDASRVPQTLGTGQTPRKDWRCGLLVRGPDPALPQQLGTAVPLPAECSTQGRPGRTHGSSWGQSVSLSGPRAPVPSFRDS